MDLKDVGYGPEQSVSVVPSQLKLIEIFSYIWISPKIEHWNLGLTNICAGMYLNLICM